MPGRFIFIFRIHEENQIKSNKWAYSNFIRFSDSVGIEEIVAETGIVAKFLVLFEIEAHMVPLGFASLSLFELLHIAH